MSQYDLKELLKVLKLPRATYYDRLKRDKQKDKYAKVKAFIKKCFYDSQETYGYRRIYDEIIKYGFHYAEETIRRLVSDMGLHFVNTDETSREVVASTVSSSPNKVMIKTTLDELQKHLERGIKPILHSDQGWQYQMPNYQRRLKDLNII